MSLQTLRQHAPLLYLPRPHLKESRDNGDPHRPHLLDIYYPL